MFVNRSNVKSRLHGAVILPGTCEYTQESDPLYAIMKAAERHLFR